MGELVPGDVLVYRDEASFVGEFELIVSIFRRDRHLHITFLRQSGYLTLYYRTCEVLLDCGLALVSRCSTINSKGYYGEHQLQQSIRQLGFCQP